MSHSSTCLLVSTPSTSVAQETVPKLKGVFLADFDPQIGPVIVHQVPCEIVSRQRFDSFSAFVIPKREVLNQLVMLSFSDIKVMGFPMCIEHGKYSRNAYFFNFCFVLDNVSSHADGIYEPMVRKIAQCLLNLEKEHDLLSDKERYSDKVLSLCRDVFEGLNEKGECSVRVTEQTTVNLKLYHHESDGKLNPNTSLQQTPDVPPYCVPLFCRQPPISALPGEMSKLDLITQKVCPLIDGRRSVAEISCHLLIDVDLVARCVRNLVCQEVLALLPVIRYRDTFVATHLLQQLYIDETLQGQCQQYVALRTLDDKAPLPAFSDIFRLYCSLQHGCVLSSWCLRYRPREHGVHELRLIEFGLLRKWLRRIAPYPVFVGRTDTSVRDQFELQCDGTHSCDALAYKFTQQPGKLLDELKNNDQYVILWK